jgi:hypothetical protein
MTDELRQVFEDWDSGKHRDIAIFIEAARAHLGCSTITDEMVEAAAKAMVERGGWVIWEATSEPLKDAARTDARAALEAARVVHREET